MVVWEGSYFDGRTAQRHPVRVEATPDGLWIVHDSGDRSHWPFDEIRQTQGKRAGEPVRLERGSDPAEVLVVADVRFLGSIRELAPAFRSRFTDPALRALRGKLALAGGLAAFAAGAVAYWWGLPALAARVAARVPLQWEEQLGASLLEELKRESATCPDPERQRAVEQIVQRLTSTGLPASYQFRVTILDDSIVNALAAPGGYIVVYRGLLETTETPEELAGVLAHEIQHVVQRHGVKAVLQEIPLRLVLAAVTGDAGITGQVLNTAVTLGALRYRRRDEEAADREGMRMLQAARIASDGMIRFFSRLEEKGEDVPAVLAYLSTHPRNRARIAELERLAAEARYPPVPLLKGYDWKRMGTPCPEVSR